MALDSSIILNGVLSLIVVLSSFLAGILILLKYKKYKQKTFLYVAITSISIFSFWWPSSISFLIAIFNDVGLQPYPSIYYIILGILTAPSLIAWMLALNSLMEKRNKKRQILVIIISLEAIFVEIIYMLFAIFNDTYIGEIRTPVDTRFSLIGIILFLNLGVMISAVTVSFSLHSMKSPLPEIRLKGIIILISGVLFLVCTFADSLLPLDLFGLTFLFRILLILNIFLMYCGFRLPNFVRKIFLKED